jgi:hypothetical protein
MFRQAYRDIKQALDRIADVCNRIVGALLQWTLLPLVYLLLFVPYRVLFRRGKRDLLTRWADRDAVSYWQDVSETPERGKQF